MPLPDLVRLIQKNVNYKDPKNSLPNGLICLKGGELTEEVKPYRKKAFIYNLNDFFEEEYFETKKAVYLPL